MRWLVLSLAVSLAGLVAAVVQPGDIVDFDVLSANSLTYTEPFGTPAVVGDLDGDGITEIVVGQPLANSGTGVLTILFLNADSTLKSFQHFTQYELTKGNLKNQDWGISVAKIGDLDGDGYAEIAVGCPGFQGGRVYIFFMNAQGVRFADASFTQRKFTIIGEGQGKDFFPYSLLPSASGFGVNVATAGDVDDDLVPDLWVGETTADTSQYGRAHLVMLTRAGGVKLSQNFHGKEAEDAFGTNPTSLGDLDGDGVLDMSASGFRDGSHLTYGYARLVFMNRNGGLRETKEITRTSHSGFAAIGPDDTFAYGHIVPLGDVDNDDLPDFLVPVLGPTSTRLWIMSLSPTGAVTKARQCDTSRVNFAMLGGFGWPSDGLRVMGDIDGDHTLEVVGVGPNGQEMYVAHLYVYSKREGEACTGGAECLSNTCLNGVCMNKQAAVYGCQTDHRGDVVEWPDLSGDFRIEAWVKIDTVYFDGSLWPIVNRLLSASIPQFELVAFGRRVLFWMHGGSQTLVSLMSEQGSFKSGVYNNVTVTVIGNTVSLYLPGFAVKTTTFDAAAAGGRVSSTQPVQVGFGGSNAPCLNGIVSILTIDDIDVLGGDYDACHDNPCYGVCTDHPPPSLYYSCSACPSGYQGDVTACADSNNGCVGQPCFASGTFQSQCFDVPFHTATEPAYVCGPCPSGFVDNGAGWCTQIDGCSNGNNRCFDPVNGCVDLGPPNAGYTCAACPAGRVALDPNNYECGNYDACTRLEPCGDGSTCIDRLPPSWGRDCTGCPAGFENNSTTACVEFDACLPGRNPCFAGVTCMDQPPPSMNATCGACPAGYIGDGFSCTNRDACSSNPCDTNLACTDLPPPHTHANCGNCPVGMYGDPTGTCKELDGCTGDPCFAGVACTDKAAPATGFTCGPCPAGYTGDDGINCQGLDPCVDKPCFEGFGRNVECVWTPSLGPRAFQCGACPVGSEGDGINCVDIDHCNVTWPGNPFPACYGNCTDLKAPLFGRTCAACPLGRVGSGIGPCVDFDACAGNPCFEGVNCTDGDPPFYNFSCGDCPTGYVKVGPTGCRDYNACDDEPCYKDLLFQVKCTDHNAPITTTTTVTNADGTTTTTTTTTNANGRGFSCAPCPPGMEGNGTHCANMDACVTDPCPSSLPCTDLPPPSIDRICGNCEPGFADAGNGSCVDFNACDPNPCYNHTWDRSPQPPIVFIGQCVDLPPPSLGFTCDPCPEDLGLEGSGISCVDKDFCNVDPPPCFPGVVCVDEPSPSTKVKCGAGCPQGFEGDGVTCTDQDFCAVLPFPCFPGTNCTDLAPPYEGVICGACPPGFVGSVGTPGNCFDRDACLAHTCHEHATCTDLPPPSESYNCTCKPGYVGDGIDDCVDFDACATNPCAAGLNCTDQPPPSMNHQCRVCGPGETRDGTGPCYDFNACGSQPCRPGMLCVDNTPQDVNPDGYQCTGCALGYQADASSTSCVPVDCGKAPFVVNGQASCTFKTTFSGAWETEPTARCDYTCNPGQVMHQGSPTILCTAQGVWNDTAQPICGSPAPTSSPTPPTFAPTNIPTAFPTRNPSITPSPPTPPTVSAPPTPLDTSALSLDGTISFLSLSKESWTNDQVNKEAAFREWFAPVFAVSGNAATDVHFGAVRQGSAIVSWTIPNENQDNTTAMAWEVSRLEEDPRLGPFEIQKLVVHGEPWTRPVYSNCKTLDTSLKARFEWSIVQVSSTSFKLTSKVAAEVQGWLAFGFSHDGTMDGGGQGSDIAIGWIGDGRCSRGCVFDYNAQTHSGVQLDDTQNVQLVDAASRDGILTIESSRLFITGDREGDRNLPTAAGTPVFLIWSAHATLPPLDADSVSKHTHRQKTKLKIDLFESSACEAGIVVDPNAALIRKSNTALWAIIAILIAFFIVVCCLCLIYCCIKAKQRRDNDELVTRKIEFQIDDKELQNTSEVMFDDAEAIDLGANYNTDFERGQSSGYAQTHDTHHAHASHYHGTHAHNMHHHDAHNMHHHDAHHTYGRDEHYVHGHDEFHSDYSDSD